MANQSDHTLLIVGGLAVAGYLILSKNTPPGQSPVTSLLNTGQNLVNSAVNLVASGTTYPYLTTGAPPLPPGYSDSYYKQYIRPAMVAQNPNVNNPGYTLTPTDAANYGANYTDVAEWANNRGVLAEKQTGGTVLGALQYHWHTYGVPDQRTFLPLPWNDPSHWVPPPPNPKGAGGGGFLGTLVQVATIASHFLGPNDELLNDEEIHTLVTSAAIIKKILPFYLEVEPDLVASIEFKLDNLLSKYQN